MTDFLQISREGHLDKNAYNVNTYRLPYGQAGGGKNINVSLAFLIS